MAWQLFRCSPDIAYYVYCDECGQMFPAKVSRDRIDRFGQIPDEKLLYCYCPSCGTRNDQVFANKDYYELYDFEGNLLKEKVRVPEV